MNIIRHNTWRDFNRFAPPKVKFVFEPVSGTPMALALIRFWEVYFLDLAVHLLWKERLHGHGQWSGIQVRFFILGLGFIAWHNWN